MSFSLDPNGSRSSTAQRSGQLLTFQESLARDRMREMQAEVADFHRAKRLRAVVKWQRRAVHADRRARQARELLR